MKKKKKTFMDDVIVKAIVYGLVFTVTVFVALFVVVSLVSH